MSFLIGTAAVVIVLANLETLLTALLIVLSIPFVTLSLLYRAVR